MVIPLRDENPTRRPAVVTVLLIALNVAAFVLWQPPSFRSAGDPALDQSVQQLSFLYAHAAVPCEITHGQRLSPRLADECHGPTLRQSADTRPISPERNKNIYLAVLVSMFLHASWLHLLGNMLFLWIFGNNVEDRLRPIPYIAFYLFCGVVAALAHALSDPTSLIPVLGASGAIAGVMGAYLVFFPRARVTTIILPFFVVPMRAWVLLILWFLLQFQTAPNSGVAWVAHVGGFIAGAVIAIMVRPWAMRGAPRSLPY